MTSTIQTRVYEVRNSKYSSSDGYFIDCEYNHPTYGWIPFTAHINDVEQHSRDIYDLITCGKAGAIGAFIPPSISSLQDQVWEAIKAERTKRMNTGGFRVQVEGVYKWFNSDEASRIQYIGLLNAGTNLPPVINWKTMDGTFTNMSVSLAGSLIGLAVVSDQAIFTAAEVHKAAMMQLANPLVYDFSTGWPIAFWER